MVPCGVWAITSGTAGWFPMLSGLMGLSGVKLEEEDIREEDFLTWHRNK